MSEKIIPISTLRRLPVYLHYLYSLKDKNTNISATAIAEEFGLNDVQVRKDLGAVSGSGRPKTGYSVTELIAQLEEATRLWTKKKTILVGAGNLGKALLYTAVLPIRHRHYSRVSTIILSFGHLRGRKAYFTRF